MIISPDRSDPGRSRSDGDIGASDASNTHPSDDNGRSADNTRGNSRAYPADIRVRRKLEIRLLLILSAPKQTATRPPTQAICTFSSYWLFELDVRNELVTLLLCPDQACPLGAQMTNSRRLFGSDRKIIECFSDSTGLRPEERAKGLSPGFQPWVLAQQKCAPKVARERRDARQ